MKGDIEVGIDEAGRGPVFGPMVYGGMAWPVSSRSHFSKLGFKDSKQLAESDRDRLFDLIKEFDGKLLHFKTLESSAQEISHKMLGTSKENLNTISFNCAYALLDHFLSLGLKVAKVYIDTVGDPDKYRAKLEDRYAYVLPNIEFTVCSKADDLFPVVSAASIAAKVTRDKGVRDINIIEQIEVSREFGSGYPGDPITVQWLDNHFQPFFGYPTVVRFSWSTISERLENKGIKYGFIADCYKKGDLQNHFKPSMTESTEQQGPFFKHLCLAPGFKL